MNYTGLTDERNEWRQQLESGIMEEPYVLKMYRLNRDSNLWRSTRMVEQLCEMILFLEGTKTMTESYIVHCDHCQCDITHTTEEKAFRLRLMEEGRVPASDSFPMVKELDRYMNFCNLNHLKDWLNAR